MKRLQQALIDAGYKSYVRTADGIYGKWTYDAVRAYQKDVGLRGRYRGQEHPE